MNGRVAGQYTFTTADALDDYALTAAGFAGEAGVRLAEYRKAKVGLAITGELDGDKLRARRSPPGTTWTGR